MDRLKKLRRNQRRPLQRYSLRAWQNGETSNLQRLVNGLAEVKNCELTQDGLIRPRSNVVNMGDILIDSNPVTKMIARPLAFSLEGEAHLISAFLMPDNSVKTAFVNRDEDDLAWKEITGITRTGVGNDAITEMFFTEARNYIVVTDGQVSFIDLSKETLTEVRPTAVDNPDEFASFTPKEGTTVTDVAYDFDVARDGTTLPHETRAVAVGGDFLISLSGSFNNRVNFQRITGEGKEATLGEATTIISQVGGRCIAVNGTTIVVAGTVDKAGGVRDIFVRFGTLNANQTVTWATSNTIIASGLTAGGNQGVPDGVALNSDTLIVVTALGWRFSSISGVGAATTVSATSNIQNTPVIGFDSIISLNDKQVIYRTQQVSRDGTYSDIVGVSTLEGSGSTASFTAGFQFNNDDGFEAYDGTTAWFRSSQTIRPGRLTGGAVTVDSDDVATQATFEYRYGFTIQTDFGETALSPLKSIGTTALRHNWHKDQFWITLDVPRPTLTINHGFNIYVGLAREGVLYRLVSNWKPAVGDTFVDNGQTILDSDVIAPEKNSTIFPKAKYSAEMGGRIILYGDTEKPNRLHYGGVVEATLLNFTETATSGNVTVGGRDEEIVSIVPTVYVTREAGFLINTRQGDATAGREFFLKEVDLASPGGQYIAGFRIEPTGNLGSISPYGVVAYNNSLYKPSPDGFKVFGTLPELAQEVSTENLDEFIRERSLNLQYNAMSACNGVAYKQKVYWSVSTIASENLNQIWVLDLTQNRGAWMTSLHIPTDWMIIANDGDGRQQMLMFKDNKMLRYSDDDGESFDWNFAIRNIYCPRTPDDDSSIRLYALVHAYVTIYQLQGRVRVKIIGRTIDSEQAVLSNTVIDAGTMMSARPGGQPGQGVSDSPTVPFRQIIVPMQVNRVVHYIDVEVSSVNNESKCMFADFSFNYKFAGDSNFDQDVTR